MDSAEKQGYVFLPGKEEALYGRARLRYSSSRNEYYSGSSETSLNGKPKKICNNLEGVLFSYENIRRTFDSITEKVYIERTNNEQNARMMWHFNFAPCGLLLDRVTMKMAYEEEGGGQVTVSLSGDVGTSSVMYQSSDVYMTITRLEGSSSLTVTINLIGENNDQITRIMSESLYEQYRHEYPFDVQIRLKRPDFTVGRSLIFIGLMYSRRELPVAGGKTKTKRRPKTKDGTENTTGFLNILVHKAKRLPCRENGTYPEPKVKCTFQGSGQAMKVKTQPSGKNLNPTWNEHLVIPNVKVNELKHSQLEVQVVHSKSLFRLKSAETLGYAVLQLKERGDTLRKTKHSINNNNNPKEKKTSTVSNGSFTTDSIPQRTQHSSFCIMTNENQQVFDDNDADYEDDRFNDMNENERILSAYHTRNIDNTEIKSRNNLIKNQARDDSMPINGNENITEHLNEFNTKGNRDRHAETEIIVGEINQSIIDNKGEEPSTFRKRTLHKISETSINTTEPEKNNHEIPETMDLESTSIKTLKSVNSESESDLLNITFQDEYYKNILSLPSSSNSKCTHDDSSFELLPSFREEMNEDDGKNILEKFPYIQSYNARKFVDIQNTLDESEVDQHIKRSGDNNNVSKKNEHEVRNNILNSLPEYSVDDQDDLPGDSEEEVIVYKPKSSIKRSVSYSEQIRNAFRRSRNFETELSEYRQEEIYEDSITTEPSSDHMHTKPEMAEQENQQQYDTTVTLNSIDDFSGTIEFSTTTIEGTTEEGETIPEKRRTQSVDNSQLTPSRSRRFEVNAQRTSFTNRTNNVKSIVNEKKTATVKRAHSFSDLIDFNKQRGEKINNMRRTVEPNDNSKRKSTLKRAHSFSDLIDINKRRDRKLNPKRRHLPTKLFRSGSVSNILDDFFEEKAKKLAHQQWDMVMNMPEKWFYCWHPLLGVNNILSNW